MSTKINIYNLTGNPDLILYFQNGGKTKNNVNLANFPESQPAYLQPWSSSPWSGDSKQKAIDLKTPYTCSYDSIESQAIFYILGNQSDGSFIEKNLKDGVSPGTGAPWWLGGFFEFTGLADQDNYWDITNVDQIGLFAGFDDGEATWGYGKTPTDMISAIEAVAPELKKTSPTPLNPESKTDPQGHLPPALMNIKISYKDPETGEEVPTSFSKLQGPTDLWAYYYLSLPSEYLETVVKAGIKAKVQGDATKDSTKPHCGPQMEAFEFEGMFYNGNYQAAKGMTLPANLKAEDVVLALTCAAPPVAAEGGVQPKEVTVLYTKDALNAKTILSGDSDQGVFIHNAYNVGIGEGKVEYHVDWITTNDVSYPAKGNGVGLNWVCPVGDPVYSTSCFQAMINSLARDVIIGFNEGSIPLTKGSTFDSQGTKSEEGKKYSNQWNNIIVENSNSYGMAYSDGAAKSKVLYHPPKGGTVNVYIYDQTGISKNKDFTKKLTGFYTP